MRNKANFHQGPTTADCCPDRRLEGRAEAGTPVTNKANYQSQGSFVTAQVAVADRSMEPPIGAWGAGAAVRNKANSESRGRSASVRLAMTAMRGELARQGPERGTFVPNKANCQAWFRAVPVCSVPVRASRNALRRHYEHRRFGINMAGPMRYAGRVQIGLWNGRGSQGVV